MISKKIFSMIAAGLLVCGFSSSASAELLSISAGLPVAHTFSSEWSGGESHESDGVSGAMVHVKLPIMIGIGYEAYETKIKGIDSSSPDNIVLNTTLYDIFWLTPIPIINFTIGAGFGSSELECSATGFKCSDGYEAGSLGQTTQYYLQLGVPIIPLFDIHASYHQVSATVPGKSGFDDETFEGNVIGLGVAFTF